MMAQTSKFIIVARHISHSFDCHENNAARALPKVNSKQW